LAFLGRFQFDCGFKGVRSHGFTSVRLLVEASVDLVVAEALATLRTIEFCRNRGFTSLILEGDSLQVMNAISKIGLNRCMYGHVIADIQQVLHGFHSLKISHTKRGANSVAHPLDKDGVHQSDHSWIRCIPDSILGMLYYQRSHLWFFRAFDCRVVFKL
jgi:hypothetical protein